MHNLRIVNLTSHDVNLFVAGQILNFKPSGTVAKVQSPVEEIGKIGSVPIYKTVTGKVEGLPDSENGTIFLVSHEVAENVPERVGIDVFIPSGAIYNGKGVLIGYRGLGVVW